MRSSVLGREADYGALAADQYGLVTSRQLIELGLSRGAISRRVKAGVLIGILPGVWRLAGVPRSWHQRVLATHLWAGIHASIAGLAAAALHNLDGFPQCKVIDVLTPRTLKPPNRLVVVRRPRAFSADDRTTVARIPTTICARTLVDIAGAVTDAQLELGFEDARRRRLVSLQEMHNRVARLPMNQPGRRKLVKLLGVSEGTRPTDSGLEVKVLQLLREQGYPPPIRQEALDDKGAFVGRVDLVYPDRRLVVEVDSHRYHEGRRDFEADRKRRNWLGGMGWTILHVTSGMLYGDALAALLRDLRRLYDRPLA